MRLRKPCEHIDDEHPEGRYEEHQHREPPGHWFWCPGGEALDPLIQELAFAIIDGQRLNIPYDYASELLARTILNGSLPDDAIVIKPYDFEGRRFWPTWAVIPELGICEEQLNALLAAFQAERAG